MFKITHTEDLSLTIKFRGRNIQKTETIYTYESNDGAKLTFYANPHKAWTWIVINDKSNDSGLKIAKDIIEHHCATA